MEQKVFEQDWLLRCHQYSPNKVEQRQHEDLTIWCQWNVLSNDIETPTHRSVDRGNRARSPRLTLEATAQMQDKKEQSNRP